MDASRTDPFDVASPTRKSPGPHEEHREPPVTRTKDLRGTSP